MVEVKTFRSQEGNSHRGERLLTSEIVMELVGNQRKVQAGKGDIEGDDNRGKEAAVGARMGKDSSKKTSPARDSKTYGGGEGWRRAQKKRKKRRSKNYAEGEKRKGDVGGAGESL